MEIQETHRVPEKTIFKSNELFKAIDGNNYQLALDINERFNRRKNINNSENIINLLLTDICVLINQYSQETQKPIDFTKDGSAISREDKLEEESMLVTTNLSLSALFSNVVAFLIKGDLVNAFRTLRVYLESIDKKDYEFLIVDLIKISLIEGDVGFTKPLITLTCINKENFEFDTPHYIQEFYIALSKNRFDEARIYLDIVAQSNKLRQDYNLTDVLLQILNSVERTIDYKRNTKVLDDVQNAFEKSQNLNFEKTKNSSVKLTKLTSQVKSPNLEITSKSVTNNICHPVKVDSEKEFIERNHEILLQDKGAILLKPMSSERIKRITEIVKKYSDMVCFTVGDDENCQIVLRYKPNNDDDIDLETLIKEGNSAYEACDYNGCIRNYLQLLQGENPSSAIYGKLGLAYMLKHDKKRAINYLTIATKLSKQRGGKRDFTKLICSLKGLPYIGNIKPSFYMKVKDFEKNTHGYYGIGNLDEITSYILQSGLGVESACNELGMTDNEIDKILLVYAREFYLQGDLKKGDEFLNAVEKRKNKTKNVIKYIAEVRNRKKFYVNRDNENPLKLGLRLQPK